MNPKIKYQFSGRMWKHHSSGGWFFVSLPKNISQEIRKNLQWQEEGWGRMKAIANTKGIEWDTAIWFSKKRDTYLLPVKAEIRKKAYLTSGDLIDVRIWL